MSSTDFSDAALGGLPSARDRHGQARAGGQVRRARTRATGWRRRFPSSRSTIRRSRRPRFSSSARTPPKQAALEVPGITNSEGGSADYGRTMVTLATSRRLPRRLCRDQPQRFGRGHRRRRHGDGARLRLCAHAHSPTIWNRPIVDRQARGGARGEAAQSAQGAHAVGAGVLRSARRRFSLIGHFAGAISGAAIARGVSFLKDKMGEQVFGESITIIDDPHRKRGLRSKPFDGEGVANRHTVLDRQRAADHLAARQRIRAAARARRRPAMPRAAPADRPRPRRPISTWRRARSRPTS